MMMLANLWNSIRYGIRRDDGATMVEYGLMLALIAIVCIIVVTAIGTSLQAVFQCCADALPS